MIEGVFLFVGYSSNYKAEYGILVGLWEDFFLLFLRRLKRICIYAERKAVCKLQSEGIISRVDDDMRVLSEKMRFLVEGRNEMPKRGMQVYKY